MKISISEVLEKIKSIDEIIYQVDAHDSISKAHVEIVGQLLQEYKDILLDLKVSV